MFFESDQDQEGRSLLVGLRDGEAGLLTRLTISIALGLALTAAAFFVLGMAEQLLDPMTRTYTNSRGNTVTRSVARIRDEHVAITMLVGSVVWFVSLIKVWSGYKRWRNLLRTMFGVLTIWAVVVPTCVVIDVMLGRSSEFLIAATIFGGLASTVVLITVMRYRYSGGRPIITEGNLVNVNCPGCGYSLIGLSESRCPECGVQYTLDELIRQQDYAQLERRRVRPAPLVAEC